MDIRNAQRVDAQAIREIWENTFHYSRGFMDWYFRTMFEEKNTILAAEEEQAIASVSIQPQEMIMAGEKMDTCYIGAFAALPEYWNKETMRDVACAMTADIGRRGFAVSVVVPFNYKFFERFGWLPINTNSIKSRRRISRIIRYMVNSSGIQRISPDWLWFTTPLCMDAAVTLSGIARHGS